MKGRGRLGVSLSEAGRGSSEQTLTGNPDDAILQAAKRRKRNESREPREPRAFFHVAAHVVPGLNANATPPNVGQQVIKGTYDGRAIVIPDPIPQSGKQANGIGLECRRC